MQSNKHLRNTCHAGISTLLELQHSVISYRVHALKDWKQSMLVNLCRDAFTDTLVPDVACRLPARVTCTHESAETSSVKRTVLLCRHLNSKRKHRLLINCRSSKGRVWSNSWRLGKEKNQNHCTEKDLHRIILPSVKFGADIAYLSHFDHVVMQTVKVMSMKGPNWPLHGDWEADTKWGCQRSSTGVLLKPVWAHVTFPCLINHKFHSPALQAFVH